MLRVLIVNTSEQTGGAAIAASRLCKALNDHGVKAKMLVRDKQTDRITVAQVGGKFPKLWERLCIWLRNGFSRKKLWLADIANTGIDITATEEYREADVIHLHWVNQGMLSLSCLQKILQSGKRVVWTLHDEWPYLGVCHYRGTCQQTDCRHCPLMSGSTPHKLLQQKRDIYRQGHITFVGCSQWITDEARKALPGEHILHIPNAIPADTFHPMDRAAARRQLHLPADRKLVLFTSMKITDERKGAAYLLEAARQLPADCTIVMVGQQSASLATGAQVISLPYMTSQQQMAQLYAAVDCFVTPSLQDNLPNTIAEAMSCGTPCVGFRVGGIPEMIAHQQDGYVAEYQNSDDLAAGICHVLSHPELREAAHSHAARMFSEEHVAAEYIKIYEG